MASSTKQTKENVGTAPQITTDTRVEFTVVEINSVLEFMLSQPMKIARNYIPVIQFLEGKLKDALNKVNQSKIEEK